MNITLKAHSVIFGYYSFIIFLINVNKTTGK